MSKLGQLHQQMMIKMECAMSHLVSAEARLENDPNLQQESVHAWRGSIRLARAFLGEAQKLASWIDTGEAE